MEIKKHMPWIASMLTTAVAFIAVRYRRTALATCIHRAAVLVVLAILGTFPPVWGVL